MLWFRGKIQIKLSLKNHKILLYRGTHIGTNYNNDIWRLIGLETHICGELTYSQ
jgi:hypothetical protein